MLKRCRAAVVASGMAALMAAGCSYLQSSAEVTPVDEFTRHRFR
ncbi:hypothetical protein [Trinickia acidisoli]|nr:hypothetical protein [Trinickia acidisoli]